MEELGRLINISFAAQCKYVMPRIHNKTEKEDFSLLYKMVAKKIGETNVPISYFDVTKIVYLDDKEIFNQKSAEMILGIYRETYHNLHSRFVTGNPIESDYIIF